MQRERNTYAYIFHLSLCKRGMEQSPYETSSSHSYRRHFPGHGDCFQIDDLPPPTGVSKNILPWICWSLWTARNLFIFEDRLLSTEEVTTRGLRSAQEWITAQGNQEKKTPAVPGIRGEKDDWRNSPLINICTTSICRTDAAWNRSTKKAGLAWIITNESRSSSTQGSSIIDNVSSPIVAEALALRSGIITAVKRSIPRMKFFSDNITLIRAINFETQAKEIFGIVCDIQRLSSEFIDISFHHISRNLISDVDLLAKKALSGYFV